MEIAQEQAETLRGEEAWVIVWKNGLDWNAEAWYIDNPFECPFDCWDSEMRAYEIVEEDGDAIVLSGAGYGFFCEASTLEEIAEEIGEEYKKGRYLLRDTTAFDDISERDWEIAIADRLYDRRRR